MDTAVEQNRAAGRAWNHACLRRQDAFVAYILTLATPEPAEKKGKALASWEAAARAEESARATFRETQGVQA